MKFAELEEMEKRREELRKMLLLPESPESSTMWRPTESDRLIATEEIIKCMVAQQSRMIGLILKLCHACEELEKRIDILDSISTKDNRRIANLETWQQRNTGDGR